VLGREHHGRVDEGDGTKLLGRWSFPNRGKENRYGARDRVEIKITSNLNCAAKRPLHPRFQQNQKEKHNK